MDDFSKPFEYDDEKVGLILRLFIIMLVSIDTFLTLSFTVQVYRIINQIQILSIGFIIMSILFLLFLLFTVITCSKLKKNMVTVSKTYLIVRTLFTTISIVIIYCNAIKDKSLIGNGPKQYKTVSELNFTILIAPLAYVVIFSVSWYLYFLKTKRYSKCSL